MLRFMLDGGFLMWVMLAQSVVAVAVFWERWRVLKSAETDTTAMRAVVLKHVGAGDVSAAVQECDRFRGPIAAVLRVGLERYRKLKLLGRTGAEIRSGVSESMTDYAPHVLSALEKRINFLLVIASTAPLLGMTGTVTGMIKAFSAMAGAESLSGGVVAGGISEALITTAAGLLIAVPTVFAYNILTHRVEQFTLRLEDAATELANFMELREST